MDKEMQDLANRRLELEAKHGSDQSLRAKLEGNWYGKRYRATDPVDGSDVIIGSLLRTGGVYDVQVERHRFEKEVHTAEMAAQDRELERLQALAKGKRAVPGHTYRAVPGRVLNLAELRQLAANAPTAKMRELVQATILRKMGQDVTVVERSYCSGPVKLVTR